jgi:hypothetical protein
MISTLARAGIARRIGTVDLDEPERSRVRYRGNQLTVSLFWQNQAK